LEGRALFISRNTSVFSWLESVFNDCGFYDVTPISLERDALAFKLNELKPKYVFINSEFYSCVTPFMIGLLHENFPDVNINVVNFGNFPDSLVVRFFYHGANSYLNVNDGIGEFKNGLNIIKTGEKYYSPGVDRYIRELDEIKNLKTYTTDREWQVLFLICNGFINDGISFYLSINIKTVETHIQNLYKKFDVAKKENLVRKAVYLGWVKKEHLVFNGNDIKIPKNPSRKRMKKIAPRMAGAVNYAAGC